MTLRWTIALCALCAVLALPARLRAADDGVRLAVLEFEVGPDLKIDRTYFSDLARGAVHRAARNVFVMTRESTEALLAANGKTMADCTGDCEVEVGRKLGADYIVSGRITQVGSRLSLTMRLFSTADGQLVESAEARGRSQDELLDHVDAAMEALVAPLAKRGAERPQPKPAAQLEAPSPAAQPPPAPSPSALPPAPPASTVEVPAPAARPALKRLAPVLIASGAMVGGASLAFDNLAASSKDNKLTAIDFLPVAGYALALALLGVGIYQAATP